MAVAILATLKIRLIDWLIDIMETNIYINYHLINRYYQ